MILISIVHWFPNVSLLYNLTLWIAQSLIVPRIIVFWIPMVHTLFLLCFLVLLNVFQLVLSLLLTEDWLVGISLSLD